MADSMSPIRKRPWLMATCWSEVPGTGVGWSVANRLLNWLRRWVRLPNPGTSVGKPPGKITVAPPEASATSCWRVSSGIRLHWGTTIAP